jgi:XTP/dITP diphosphohydrolase
MNTRETQLKAFDRLLGIMEELREKCPGTKSKRFKRYAILPLKKPMN